MSINTKVERNNQTIGTDAVESVRERISKVGYGEWTTYKVGATAHKQVTYVAQTLTDYLMVKNPSLRVSDSDIEEFLTNLIDMRVLQVSKNLPKNIVSRDIPVPDFFRPILMRVGKYEDPLRALQIEPWPCITEESGEERLADGKEAMSFELDMSKFERVARLLKATGIRFTTGLPGELTIPDDGIFRISEGEDGSLLVAGADVTEVDLVVRSIVKFTFLSSVFGAARTRYVSVEDLRPAWDAIVSTAVSL